MNGDMIGRVIQGRYKLIDERGRGSFATVYIVRDLGDNQIYALKVMHQELSDDGELLARFQREAHILLNLSDTHIVRIFDYGNDNNMHYIVMDYIDGQSLKYFMINDGPLDPLRALNYTRQIVEGLDTAYKQGVVHRDIKPQNILIDSKDMVKITDFGLARGRDTVTLTQSNVFMGTAYYISPEQAESGRSADTRSDLYSVATVLFEMLAGRPPYEGETAVDIVIKQMNEKVPSICRLRPELPLEMDLLCKRRWRNCLLIATLHHKSSLLYWSNSLRSCHAVHALMRGVGLPVNRLYFLLRPGKHELSLSLVGLSFL